MPNIAQAVTGWFLLITQGLGALARLVPHALAALKGEGELKARLAAEFTKPECQRDALAVLRAFWPNVRLSQNLIKAYPGEGTLIVTRHADVLEVLDRESDFETVYEPRMRVLTGGANFFLGMQDIPAYTRDLANMRLAVRREDLPGRVAPFFAGRAAAVVAGCGGRLDVPAELTLRLPAQMLADYFGLPGPNEATVIGWATDLFHYIFLDLTADPAVTARAETTAALLRAHIDGLIAARKASGEARDDVLGRCLALQKAGSPGMDDTGIRDNLMSLVTAAVPTLSKSSVQALDQLLDRPEALAMAQAAARAGDDRTLAACIWEALRLNPMNAVIYRRAARDCVLAAHTLRARKVAKGTMVFAANLSAMFDPLRVPDPRAFRTDRAASEYILWGYGRHVCFGAYINEVALPAMLKPLLAAPGLRRAAGAAGRIDTGGTPFPQHFHIEFDAAGAPRR